MFSPNIAKNKKIVKMKLLNLTLIINNSILCDKLFIHYIALVILFS